MDDSKMIDDGRKKTEGSQESTEASEREGKKKIKKILLNNFSINVKGLNGLIE